MQKDLPIKIFEELQRIWLMQNELLKLESFLVAQWQEQLKKVDEQSIIKK